MIRDLLEMSFGVLIGLFIAATLMNIKYPPVRVEQTCINLPIKPQPGKSNYNPGTFESEVKRTQ